MGTITYIIGILLGALITSAILYVLTLRKKTSLQEKLIKDQHELIETLLMALVGKKLQAIEGKEEDKAKAEEKKEEEKPVEKKKAKTSKAE